MRVGIPRGLLYYKYHTFMEKFFSELGAEIIVSPSTDKEILDRGVKYCVSEACLPIKIFHGHVDYLKDKCDIVLVPRVMSLYEREYICPKFCGLPEMIKNSIDSMPDITVEPIYADTKQNLYKWAKKTGAMIVKDRKKVEKAFNTAINSQRGLKNYKKESDYPLKVALIGHPYNVYDTFINMNLIKKLSSLGIGVITDDEVDDEDKFNQIKKLYKRPFWTFARNSYGTACYLAENSLVDGIIYISSFGCGTDSIIIELIQNEIREFPFMILKVDEHTGQAGYDTRIEAFVDMLESRF